RWAPLAPRRPRAGRPPPARAAAAAPPSARAGGGVVAPGPPPRAPWRPSPRGRSVPLRKSMPGGRSPAWDSAVDDAVSLVQRAVGEAARRGDGPEWKRPLRVHVTSVGGVGTTGFIEELRNVSARIRTNDPIDNDQVKHAPYLRLVGEVDAGSVPHRRFKAKLPDKMIYLSAR
ncbi:unnamed protein product, partial [Prorocentrum cordatum]